MLDQAQSCWLWLSQLDGLGPTRLAKIYQHFGSSEELLKASAQSLLEAGFQSSQRRLFERFKDNLQQGRCCSTTAEWLKESEQHHLLTIESEHYPEQLRQISDPPTILFAKGDVELLKYPQIAIIGSRRATAQGLDNAYQFSRYLSNQGLIPTSGLALGIDSKAHQGGLDGLGLTVAVLGTGIDQVYPRSNTKIFNQVIENKGVIISEYPLGTPPISYNFPKRNRIISGLSLGCLVIEATIKSGSLITARMALEQSREVFAVPGSIHNPASRGCHQLIREGALLVDNVDQIYEAISGQLSIPNQEVNKIEPIVLPEGLPAQELQLIEVIGFENCSFDALVEKTSIGPSQLSQLLLSLELKGLVRIEAGAYQRIHE